MLRATIFIHYEMMNVMGVLLPSGMAAEVAVTERCGSGAAGGRQGSGLQKLLFSFLGHIRGEAAMSSNLSRSQLSSNSVKAGECC